MRRSAIVTLALISCTACSSSTPAAEDELAPAPIVERPPAPEPPAEAPKPPEPPQWLLLPWDTKLRVAPEQYAPALTLAPPSDAERAARDRGRVIKVVGKADPEGRWWQLDTGVALDSNLAGLPIEGLGFYALSLYVPAGTGEALLADTPIDPMVAREAAIEAAVSYGMIGLLAGSGVLTQSGQPRPAKLDVEWVIDVGARAYWPDGSAAGTVRERHAFIEAGASRTIESRELRCFGIRVGPPVPPPTELCFEPVAISETKVTKPTEVWTDDDEIWGGLTAEIEDYGGGGLGYGLQGFGTTDSGLGRDTSRDIGSIGHGSKRKPKSR